MASNADFKARLTAREALLGAFFKTPQPILIEVMARAGFDFLVVDGEHAPFDRGDIDTMVIAGRAAGLPLIVRVPDPGWIGYVLDAGAAGIMVPHVTSAEQARALVRAVRYGPGGRGFAGTTRAADYAARSMGDHLGHPEAECALICQIEEPEGVEAAEEIAAVEGVDCLFVGRADLAVSGGINDFFAPEVIDQTNRTLGVSGAATGLYCAPTEETAPFRAAGGSMFVVGSDHTLMVQGGRALREAFERG